MLETQDLMTVKQAAALLQLNERTIRNHINGNHLPARKLPGGKSWFIRREDIFAVLQETLHSHKPDETGNFQSGYVRSGIEPIQTANDTGVIRRTHTLEGRARALAALDSLLDSPKDEQRLVHLHDRTDRNYFACKISQSN